MRGIPIYSINSTDELVASNEVIQGIYIYIKKKNKGDAIPVNHKQVGKKQARWEKFCSIYTLLLIELRKDK